MNQPEWELIANLGDADPIEHGGVFVYRDRTGVYPEKCEILEPHHGKQWEVYRFVLERCTFIGGVLFDNSHNPDHEAWFADSLDGMASTIGRDAAELRAAFCSDDPLKRADAYRTVGEYHGFQNLDQYPIMLKRSEVERRYPEYASR